MNGRAYLSARQGSKCRIRLVGCWILSLTFLAAGGVDGQAHPDSWGTGRDNDGEISTGHKTLCCWEFYGSANG